ncbi:MAG: hypothetical protein ACRENA_04165 [Vulcanimicrobiaceae bacterium]
MTLIASPSGLIDPSVLRDLIAHHVNAAGCKDTHDGTYAFPSVAAGRLVYCRRDLNEAPPEMAFDVGIELGVELAIAVVRSPFSVDRESILQAIRRSEDSIRGVANDMRRDRRLDQERARAAAQETATKA